ncbi:MAG: radical SAM protein [Bacteroidota bacterium]
MITINEIFHSIQGESTYAGRRCVFVRLTYCNLRCTYCDTEYAFYDGEERSIKSIIDEIKKYDCNFVEITGGEPLMQEESLELMKTLCDLDYEVMLETGGSLPIDNVDERVKIIMDLKTPSSGMMKKNYYENISKIKNRDEIKFVIGSREDYNWSKDIIQKYNLNGKCSILFSVVFDELEPIKLSEWILEDKLDVIYQLQMHKYIWEPDKRGV